MYRLIKKVTGVILTILSYLTHCFWISTGALFLKAE